MFGWRLKISDEALKKTWVGGLCTFWPCTVFLPNYYSFTIMYFNILSPWCFQKNIIARNHIITHLFWQTKRAFFRQIHISRCAFIETIRKIAGSTTDDRWRSELLSWLLMIWLPLCILTDMNWVNLRLT